MWDLDLFSCGVAAPSLSSGVFSGNGNHHFPHPGLWAGNTLCADGFTTINNCHTPGPGPRDRH